MKTLLLLLLLLSGCASHRPAPATPRVAAIAALPPGVDSLVVVPRPPLFGRLGKKAVVNIYYGPATVIGKKATAAIGPGAHVAIAEKHANQATDSATQQVATNAVAGRGNTVKQTAETKQATDWKAKLTGPLGWALAAVLVGGGVYLLWPLIVRRSA